MSEDHVSQPEDTVSRSEFVNLQEQLKAMRGERDRQIFEKSEIVARANVFARERDELRASLNEAAAERDRLARERDEALSRAESASRSVDDAARRLNEVNEEIARLKHAIATAPSSDPAAVLWTFVSEKTRAAVAWTRAKIPADSPALPWFDRAVEVVTQIGCAAVKTGDAFLRWALPRALALAQRARTEIEARLAKKG